MYWLEWRCHSITVAGALNNEKAKAVPESVLNVKWQWKQHGLQFPKKSSCNDDAAWIEDGKPFQAHAAEPGRRGRQVWRRRSRPIN